MNFELIDKHGNPILEDNTYKCLEGIELVKTRTTKKTSSKTLITMLTVLVITIVTTIIIHKPNSISQHVEEVDHIHTGNITYETDEIDSSIYCETIVEEAPEVEIGQSTTKYFKPANLPDELFDVVTSECENNGLPVNVALAVMKTETQDFNTEAINYNSNGTYDSGIMQINSSNVRGFSKRYDCPEFAANPNNPKANITVGIRYLAENYKVYLEHYNGDELKTLLATAGSYNRGVGGQNRYRNIYEYNARVYAHWINLENRIDININYKDEIPAIKSALIESVQL